MSGYRITRVRRSAIPIALDVVLDRAKVGDRCHPTFYGVPSEAVITELTREWVEFRAGEDAP